MKQNKELRQRLGEKRCRGGDRERITASGNWNERWGGKRWRSKS